MEWVFTDERLPKTKGIYGISNKNKNNPLDFSLAYFDGIGFKLIQEKDEFIAPYRTPRYWLKIILGADAELVNKIKWIDVNVKLPNENEYVLICIGDYIGISRLINGEWDCGVHHKRPMFRIDKTIRTKLDAEYWMPFPGKPKGD